MLCASVIGCWTIGVCASSRSEATTDLSWGCMRSMCEAILHIRCPHRGGPYRCASSSESSLQTSLQSPSSMTSVLVAVYEVEVNMDEPLTLCLARCSPFPLGTPLDVASYAKESFLRYRVRR